MQAYVTLLSNRNYLEGVLVLNETLKQDRASETKIKVENEHLDQFCCSRNTHTHTHTPHPTPPHPLQW